MKVRCSSLGRLMGGFEKPRAELSETAKDLIIEIAIKDKYGREPIIDSKEMQKGRRVEEDSITLLSDVRKMLYIKNKENLSNEFITGTLDLKYERIVSDIKSSFNLFTFAKAGIEHPYAWQLTGYMWLADKDSAELIYTLVNAPEDMIFDEFKRTCFMTGTFEENKEAYAKLEEDVRRNMTYDDIPKEKRVKIFTIARDEKKIELIKAKHKLAQEFYDTIINSI